MIHSGLFRRDALPCVTFVIALLVFASISCKKQVNVSTPQVMENLVYSANEVEFKMIYVEGGTFIMGTNDTVDTYPRERPAHQVTVPSFYIAETEVTQELWTAVMGYNPSLNKTNKLLPVESMTWNECQKFILRLNELTGEQFSLPTEAEWEWAAIGGAKSNGYLFAGSDYPPEIGWIADNSQGSTHVVKGMRSNELGIYDMTGNVWEWCQDWYATDYYSFSPEYNPQGPPLDPNLPADSIACHPMRGGSFTTVANRCRNTHRVGVDPTAMGLMYGMRLVKRLE